MRAVSERMYYWVDHTAVCKVNSGVQRVTRGLARALLARGQDVVPVIWDPFTDALLPATNGQKQHLARWNGPRFPGLAAIAPAGFAMLARCLSSLGRTSKVPLHESARLEGAWLIVPEVTHITPHSSPPTRELIGFCRGRGMRIAFVFYDALPIKYDLYRGMRAAHERYMLEIAEADLILPISELSAQDLSGYFAAKTNDSPRARIVACPLPGEFSGIARVTAADMEPGKPVKILSVGSVDRRKNQAMLVAAFQKLLGERSGLNATLALVGGLSPEVAGVIRRATADPRIRFLGTVSDAELADLYRTATFTVFPSLEEGFGLPILESLWFGKPCICAGFGAMHEVAAGGGCLEVDTSSPDALKNAVALLTDDVVLRHRLSAAAIARHIRTWDEYAIAVLELINDASERQ